MEDVTPLTEEERRDFEKLHRRAKKSQIQMYRDLREIHDRMLYREKGTWDEYLARYWDGALRQTARRWFDYVWMTDMMSPAGDINPSQRQARELARLHRALASEAADGDGQLAPDDEARIDAEVIGFAQDMFEAARADDRQLAGDEIARAVDERLGVERPHRESGYDPATKRKRRAEAIEDAARRLCEDAEPLGDDRCAIPLADVLDLADLLDLSVPTRTLVWVAS
jgi:hypothetical protein